MQATRLANGVRVLSERLPDLTSTTVGIWVENGSRYERAEQAGISHFLEHLFFKGTARRTAAQIAQEIDAVGGVLNAFTGKEYTCYYAKVLREHLPLALDLLADIFTQSTFAAAEIERERSVLMQAPSRAAPRAWTAARPSPAPASPCTRSASSRCTSAWARPGSRRPTPTATRRIS